MREVLRQVKGIKRYKLLGIKQVSYKDVTYSTGNTANTLYYLYMEYSLLK